VRSGSVREEKKVWRERERER